MCRVSRIITSMYKGSLRRWLCYVDICSTFENHLQSTRGKSLSRFLCPLLADIQYKCIWIIVGEKTLVSQLLGYIVNRAYHTRALLSLNKMLSWKDSMDGPKFGLLCSKWRAPMPHIWNGFFLRCSRCALCCPFQLIYSWTLRGTFAAVVALVLPQSEALVLLQSEAILYFAMH